MQSLARSVSSENSKKSSISGMTTTTESFTYMKEIKTNDGTPAAVPGVHSTYSTATTVAADYSPRRAPQADPPTARVLDVAFADPPQDAVVVDLSAMEDSPTKVVVKVETIGDDSPQSFYAQMKKLGYCASPPDTPSGKSPPKKKPDTCPSNEKLFGRKARVVDVPEDKENEDKFVAAAPYFYHNSERHPLQSGKAITHRKDQMNQKDAVLGWKNRKSTKTVQSVIAPDSKKKIACKAPPPDPTPTKTETMCDEEPMFPPTKQGVWSLKESACKDEFAFQRAVKVKKADVVANRVANAARKIARATDREADEVYSDIMMEIRLGIWRPAEAKAHVNAYGK